MARFREKISTFIFGLSVGLLIGCAIFIFKLDDYIKNFRFSDNNKPEFEETTNLKDDLTENREKKKKSGTGTGQAKEKKEVKNDNGRKQLTVQDTLVPINAFDNSNAENISVLKEELISVKNIRVKTEADNKQNGKDSLAAAVAGVTEKASGDFMLIEFWKTPLNSKGYRMSRNKVVLYGLPEQDVDIVKMDDVFYLRSNNNMVYRLTYSNEFRKMEKVSESAILARLN